MSNELPTQYARQLCSNYEKNHSLKLDILQNFLHFQEKKNMICQIENFALLKI